MSSVNSFADNGFQVFKNAVPYALIDECLFYLNKLKRRKTFIYYSQSTHRWIRPQLSEYGFLVDSILNPSLQIQAPRFAKSVKNILYCDGIYEALCSVSGDVLDFVSWQDMAFDKSTGTVDHLDSWYLDTEHPGGVIGVWIALEDISSESGPFFVCPGSHKLGPISKNDVFDHNQFLSQIQSRIADNHLKRMPMLLSKGDILLWNSLLIHGALSASSESFSRKSLTSHFYPLGKRRNDGLSSTQLLSDIRHLKSTSNPRIHRFQKPGRSPLFYALGGPLLAIKDRIGFISSSAWNMRR